MGALRVGVVIQGPMVSVGKSGQTGHLPDDAALRQGLATLHCGANVLRLLEAFGSTPDCWVLSTWESEDTSVVEGEIPVVKSRDDTRSVRGRQGAWTRSNKLRQMFSFQQGVNHLARHERPDVVVKIRTDQFLRIDLLVTELRSLFGTSSESGVVAVPFEDPEAPWFLEDFYMAGDADRMRKILDAYLEDGSSFHHFAHSDYFFKFAFHLLPDLARSRPQDFFPYRGTPSSSSQIQLVSEAWHRAYRPLQSEIWRSLEWRGSALSAELLARPRIHSEQFGEVGQLQVCQLAADRHNRNAAPVFLGRPSIDRARYLEHRLGGRLGGAVGAALLRADQARRRLPPRRRPEPNFPS